MHAQNTPFGTSLLHAEVPRVDARMASRPTPPTWVAHAQRVPDSIGWAGLPSDPSFGCITPPPFGRQCTLPRDVALAACMAMPRCVAITCPDPSESHIGTRGISGPVCQLRSSRTPNERGHGMCKPGGCINVALSRIRRPPSLHNWRSLGGPSEALRNPSLLFLHGDINVHALLLPPNVHRYWPLEGAALSVEAALPNSGMLFIVDALPSNVTSLGADSRFPRPDLWRAERGRAGGWRGRRAAQHGGVRGGGTPEL